MEVYVQYIGKYLDYEESKNGVEHWGVLSGNVPELEDNLDDNGMLLEADSLNIQNGIKIYGWSLETIIENKAINNIEIFDNNVELNEGLFDNLHLVVGKYIFMYYLHEVNWDKSILEIDEKEIVFKDRVTKYVLHKIYDGKNSDRLRIAKSMLHDVQSLDKEQIQEILAECTEVRK